MRPAFGRSFPEKKRASGSLNPDALAASCKLLAVSLSLEFQ